MRGGGGEVKQTDLYANPLNVKEKVCNAKSRNNDDIVK